MKQKTDLSDSGIGLEEQASAQLNSGHYKEAIGLYKKLWLESGDDKWQQQIAYCYSQRALDFAARGMIKEAVVLWDNQSQHISPPYYAYDHYISWLIYSKKNQSGIQQVLSQLSTEELDETYPELAVLLGILILSKHPEYQQYISEDSIFIAHLKIAQSVLQSYKDNNQTLMQAELKKIPFRSAFRDFRTVFNAVTLLDTSREKAREILVKIPSHSPYLALSKILYCCTLQGSELANKLHGFSHKQRKIISDIVGLNKKQQSLVDYLVKNKDRLSDKVKFNFAIQSKAVSGILVSQPFCQAMLVKYPAGERDFKKTFSSINAFEKNRYQALAYEADDNHYDAEYYWMQCIIILKNEKTDNALKIALILRHIADQLPESVDQIDLIIESIEYDAKDIDSYKKILNYYSQQGESDTGYKHWLKISLKSFPLNIDILSLAVNTAFKNKSYKKASQYAKKILGIDPLNSFAKQIVFTSHLAHARKLIQSKKFHLVEKEIQLADNIKLGKKHTIQTQLLRGFYCFADQDKNQGITLISEALNQLHNDPVNMQFQAIMDILSVDLPLTTILRSLPTTKVYLLSEQDFSLLIKQVNQYAEENCQQEYLNKALEKIKPALKNSISKQNFDELLLLTFCQTMNRICHYELIRHCAKIVLKNNTSPIWVYYKIYSANSNEVEKATSTDILQLEHQRELAFQNKDNKAMVLIDNYLDRYYRVYPYRNINALDKFFESEPEEIVEPVQDPLEELFAHIPEKIMLKIDRKAESLLKNISPEMLVQQLSEQVGTDKNLLFAMMQNPDLFSALILLKSADELGLDIGVKLGDILDCFEIEKQTDIFSFPFN